MVVYKYPKPTRRVRTKWNKIYSEAGSKPKRVVIPDDPILLALEMLRKSGKNNTLRYLDLGCGEGTDVILMAKKGADAVGIDVSEVAIERARRFARKERVKAAFVHGNPLRKMIEGKFDIVASRFVLHAVRNVYQKRFVETMMRYTKEGGLNVLVYHTTFKKGERIEGFQSRLEKFYAKKRWKVRASKEEFSGSGFTYGTPIHWKYLIAQRP